MGLYVLVASPELTMPPMDAGMDVLKTYGGVVNVGVGTRKLGRVVGIVVCGVNGVTDGCADPDAVAALLETRG